MNTKALKELVKQFNCLMLNGASSECLDELAEQIQRYNMSAYDIQTPFIARRNRITDFELEKWERISELVPPSKNTKLFEMAFGSGRDLLIAKNLGYDVYGCELSNYLYMNFLAEFKFDSNKIIQSDIRNIPFCDNSFDLIRHNASFLHMPIIGPGYTVHKCLEESYRLLTKNGCLYIFTKEGQGFETIDTLDGLGKRSFQLYTEKTLKELLHDCGFAVTEFNHYNRERNGKRILWIEAFAYKND